MHNVPRIFVAFCHCRRHNSTRHADVLQRLKAGEPLIISRRTPRLNDVDHVPSLRCQHGIAPLIANEVCELLIGIGIDISKIKCDLAAFLMLKNGVPTVTEAGHLSTQ